MKKYFTTLLIAGGLTTIIAASSCTREFTCQCVISYSGAPGLPDTTIREYSITDTKKNARSACQANSGTYVKDGITTVEDCDLF
ncbi:MAG: hypothetical protein QM642_00175 [Edaphocola sp.]